MREPRTDACGDGVIDVVIAGAGPAGAAAAITLARHGARVTVVDPGSTPRWKPGESLAPRAGPLLRRLGALEAVAAGPHTPCLGNQSLWGAETPGEVDFLSSPHGTGRHLDRAHFDRTLLDTARLAGARLRTARVRSARRAGAHWQLSLGPGGGLRARYLIDATGAGARLARQAGATVVKTDRMVALTARLPYDTSGHAPPRTSLVESAPFGWWYTAPLPAGSCFVMAVTDADLVAGRALHRPDGWWRALQETTLLRRRLDRAAVAPPSGLRVVRAATSCTVPAAAAGWAAVGDAATACDPIAARGIVTALATGIAAADAVHADASGDPTALGTYAELVGASHEEFLRGRLVCYGAERRWNTPFWNRRHPEPPGPGTARPRGLAYTPQGYTVRV
ncbi:NAD(P)/FAD-dependent oxidoreductase [Streptomyces yangpuensis]|uniref:NAD(P)/FAD-dependent oxidoreductase n=1 Tax=Streptomyces yangpuensis TaxID=1648182 RepID=UPI0036300C35